MSEPVTKIYRKNGEVSFYSERWGGVYAWMDAIDHPNKILNEYKKHNNSTKDLRSALDGAILVDEDSRGIVVGVWLSDHRVFNTEVTPEAFYGNLLLRNCQTVRDCFVKFTSEVWQGWQVKIANLEFAEPPDLITVFSEIEGIPLQSTQDCIMTEAEMYRYCMSVFFKIYGFPLKTMDLLEQREDAMALECIENRVSKKVNKWLKQSKQELKQEEIGEISDYFFGEVTNDDRVYDALCKVYKSILK